jgi:hypothetical protein
MGRLTLEEIKNGKSKFAFREKEVELPDLGGSILLRSLSVAQAGALFEKLVDPATGKPKEDVGLLDLSVSLLTATCVDPALSADDAKGLVEAMPVVEWGPILEEMRTLAGMGDDAQAETEAAGKQFRGSEE